MAKERKFKFSVNKKGSNKSEIEFFSKTMTDFLAKKAVQGNSYDIWGQQEGQENQFIGNYKVDVKGTTPPPPPPPPTHTCPQGQHWDDAQGKCVPDTVTPPPPPPGPTPAGLLWSSAKWANGHARKIVGVAVDPDDNQMEMRAGQAVDGRKELVIDGKGEATQTGERYRQYIWNKPGQAGSQGGAE